METDMRRPIFLMLYAVGALHLDAFAQRLPAVTQLQVQARGSVQDLVCEKRPPVVRPPAAPNPDPMEVLTPDLVETMLSAETSPASAPPAQSSTPVSAQTSTPSSTL